MIDLDIYLPDLFLRLVRLKVKHVSVEPCKVFSMIVSDFASAATTPQATAALESDSPASTDCLSPIVSGLRHQNRDFQGY
ncbi:hypothetical protein [Pseudomonas serbica]|uniref:hypothetical protein n=1 Tax=Pseudomonas serbica TaxID=2965074 RepID=UPI0039E3AE13